MFYLAAVALGAAAFGVRYGLFGALLGVIAFNALFSEPALRPTLGQRQDVVNLVAFAAAAWVAGCYSEDVRRGRDALNRLSPVLPRVQPAVGSGPVRREVVRVVQALGLVERL